MVCVHRQCLPSCVAGKAGEWERTVQIYEALQDSDLKADVWTFTSLINACQSCGSDWKSGLEVFQDMEEQGKSREQSCGQLHAFVPGACCSIQLATWGAADGAVFVSCNVASS